ncbi:MAG TPA: hypothetical protein VGL97_12530 [Bryobacteraceae bacterium]
MTSHAGKVLLDTHVVVDAATTAGFEAMPLKVRLQDPDAELLFSVASKSKWRSRAGLASST